MNLGIGDLRKRYQAGKLKPTEVVDFVCDRVSARADDHVWIYRNSRSELLDRARTLENGSTDLPLYGIPFAVKDNIDVAGVPTTAGCPAFAYTAAKTATVVQRILDAGAMLIGKTNLDQFATGLVGVRSPYGIARNPFDARFIPGGSSSGSAVAVSSALVSFALGTDTAGSGRVPAAFNNIVGLKPTRGVLSTNGVVPACRTLDCVSVFTLTCDDAALVAQLAAGYDPADSFSRPDAASIKFEEPGSAGFEFGMPYPAGLQFFGNDQYAVLFDRAVHALGELGGQAISIDYAPFREAATMLYSGPWVAERAAALKPFFAKCADAAHPVTRRIIEGSARFSAVETFEAFYRLAELKRSAQQTWDRVPVMLAPTAGTIYTVAEVEAEPFQLNTNLGYYTNFVNLLDCCAVSVPAGFTWEGLPFGVSLIGPAGQDAVVLAIARRLHRLLALPLGATKTITPAVTSMKDWATIAVVGAHLRGMPLNGQLIAHGGRFVRQCRTAPIYRLYEISDSEVRKPGLVRSQGPGYAIEVELWDLPLAEFGRFVAGVPCPLGIGTVILESGEPVQGFLCESALAGDIDISGYGGWREYLAASAVPRE
jgi:allophanate hydrolase